MNPKRSNTAPVIPAEAGIQARIPAFTNVMKELESRKESHIELGLEKIFRVLHKLGDPQEKIRVVHVAGTNAKGSVCRMLYSVLCAAGYKAGVYYSPHLNSPLERIELAGRMIHAKDFTRLYHKVLGIPGQEKLTYFEMMTAIALLYYTEKKADIVVLETGLGGRLDATNVCRKPLLTMVTSIGLDHKEWLGSTLASVAYEKGGIFKAGVPVLVGNVPAQAKRVLTLSARKAKARFIRFLKPRFTGIKQDWQKGIQSFIWESKQWKIPMLGRHQVHNAQLVLKAIQILNDSKWLCQNSAKFSVIPAEAGIQASYRRRPVSRLERSAWTPASAGVTENGGFRHSDKGFSISRKAAVSGLSQARIPGRWDLRFIKGKPWVFDVGHNPDAVQAFLQTLKQSPWHDVKPKTAWVGFLKDKDYPAMARQLIPHFDEFILTPPDSDRAASARDMQRAFAGAPSQRLTTLKTVSAAARLLRRNPKSRFIAVLGSFRLVAPALR